jgi:hypothetical protein
MDECNCGDRVDLSETHESVWKVQGWDERGHEIRSLHREYLIREQAIALFEEYRRRRLTPTLIVSTDEDEDYLRLHSLTIEVTFNGS